MSRDRSAALRFIEGARFRFLEGFRRSDGAIHLEMHRRRPPPHPGLPLSSCILGISRSVGVLASSSVSA